MQLSDLIDKPITLRKKSFIGPPYHDVQATILVVNKFSVKCKLGDGIIYIPKQYFLRKESDLLNRIIQLPTWFSLMTKEELETALEKHTVK